MALSREEEFTIEDLMKSAANLPYNDSGLEYLNAPSEVIFNRVLNRVSPTDPGMFRETPGREGESVYGEENFIFEDLMREDLMRSAANLPYMDSGDPDGPNPARPRQYRA